MSKWFSQMFSTSNKDPPTGSTNAPSPSGSASGSDVRYGTCPVVDVRVSGLSGLRWRAEVNPLLPRPDGRVSYGFSLMRGKRASMEDFYHAQVGVEASSRCSGVANTSSN